MRIKQASTCTLLLIINLSWADWSIIRELGRDETLLPSDPATQCQVSREIDIYVVGGDVCIDFPKNYTFDGAIQQLSLAGSSITQLKKGDFGDLSFLKSLTIEKNAKLRGIDGWVFSGLADLENLTVINNAQLMYIDLETFAGLVSLKHLVLSKNAFTDFYCISQAVRPDVLPSMVSLDVSENTFRCINYTDAYHMNSTVLQELRLSSCSINHIEGTSFNNLANLRTLSIDNNNLQANIIVDLIGNISENSNKFTELHIGANAVLDPNIVLMEVAETKISILDFGYTRFRSIIREVEFSVPSIVHLDLTHTRSRFPSDYFTPDRFPNIEYLYLASNYMLDRPFSLSLPKIRILDLSNNVQTNAYDSIFNAGFRLENMTSLEILKLNGNPITQLTKGSFQNLPSLKELYLVNTSINSFGFAPFSDLSSLELLDLSQNFFYRSKTINNTTFIGLSNLSSLFLENSNIDCLGDTNAFLHTPKLQYLSLKHNQLLDLHYGLLFPVPHLNFLDLGYNSFQSWDQRMFEKNNNLETLLLGENQISTFTSAMLQDFSGLKRLDLIENPLSCDCEDLSTIFPYIDSGSAHSESALINALMRPDTYCSRPLELRFSSVFETAKQLQAGDDCEHKNMDLMFQLAIICLGLVLVISIPTFYFLRWHIKYWIFLLRQAMSCYIFPKRKAPVPPGKYMYDAFVSYSHEDRGFVVRLVSMLENKAPRFRLCVFERDFAVGDVITDSVVDNLAKSKRTILILSDAFARSTWCQWEMNLAQHKRLFFKDDQHGPLIIIKIGEIMEKHMTPTLRYLTKTRIYLQWNSDPIKQKVFWEKLRSALAAPLNDGDDYDRPALQHAVLSTGETVNNNKITLNETSESVDV